MQTQEKHSFPWIWAVVFCLGLGWSVQAGPGSFPNSRQSNRFSLKQSAGWFAWPAGLKPEDTPSLAPQPVKKPLRFVLMSLILPGSGEWVMGHHTAAKILFLSEAALWAGFLGSKAYTGVLERDFHAFAALHAAVDAQGKDDQYWIDVGNASNIFEFNQRRIVQRNLEATYPETDTYFWQWDSEENRLQYSKLRSQHQTWERRTTLIIAGVVLNHLVSAIDIVRLIHKDRKQSTGRQSRLFWEYRHTPYEGQRLALHVLVNL